MASEHNLVSVYLNEADEWEGRPLHLAMLDFLNHSGCAGATVIRGLAGFTAGAKTVSAPQAEAGSKLPVVVEFVDRVEVVGRVLPELRRMAAQRLITIQDVQVVSPRAKAA